METIILLLLVYVALAPRVMMPFYRTMIFYPAKYPQGFYDSGTIDGIKPEDFYVTGTNGKRIHGWYYNNNEAVSREQSDKSEADSGSDVIIAISHGNAGNLSSRVDLCAMMLRTGASVLVYDYQGYGKSEGSPSLENICQDGLAVHDWLVKERGIEPDRIVHLGESLGSGVACYISSKRPCRGIILQSGFSSLMRIAKEVMPYLVIYPDFAMPDYRLDNLKVLKGKHVPVLIVHGARDDLIPVSHGKRLFNEGSEPKRLVILPNAGHNDIYHVDSDLYFRAVNDFLITKNGK